MKLTNRSSQLLQLFLTMGRKFVALVGLLGCAAVPVQAGIWSEEPRPTSFADIGSGISLTKIYTHAVDWGSDDGGALINGVLLAPAVRPALDGWLADVVGANFILSGTTHTFQNNPFNNYDGGMFDMNDDFLFSGGVSPFQTLTLTGLTGGVPYLMTSYLSNGWSGAFQVLSADDPGFTSATFDRGDAAGPKAILYSYMLNPGDTDIVFTFDAVDDANGFHHYGFTNEVVGVPVPEPAGTGILLGLGIAGLIAFARWSRRPSVISAG